MRKILALGTFCFLMFSTLQAQEHFLGITTSKRGGLLNGYNNPAELSNMNMKFDVNIFNSSFNFSNNKVSFNDLLEGNNLEKKLFNGSVGADVRIDALLIGPGLAYKNGNWTYAVSTLANVKANIININTAIGEAIQNGALSNVLTNTVINAQDNQRINAATWGEVNLSLSRKLVSISRHQINAGATIKLLFPSAYANFSTSGFNGTIVNNLGNIDLVNANAQVNLAYSGFLGNDFKETSSYTNFFNQGLNGVAFDIGGTYRYKKADSEDYILSAGLAIKNIGSMNYKDDTNTSLNYNLNVQGLQSLDLNQFENVTSLTQLDQIIAQSVNAGFFQKTKTTQTFKINLPTTVNIYADLKLASKLYATASILQKVADDSDSDFTTTQNTYTLIPRFVYKGFELFAPQTSNEISGFTSGFGMRLSGFFIGSSSIVTAALDNSKQADIYIGFRFGI